MSLFLMLAMQAVAPANPDPITFDLLSESRGKTVSILQAGSRCPAGQQDDIVVVCGSDRGKYRLPLPDEREAAAGHVRGEVPGAAAVLVPSGRCGIFAGERSCSKAEGAQYGYGEGRDPITLLVGLGTALVDPDAGGDHGTGVP